MTETRIAEVIDALVAVLGAGLAGKVIDGPPVTNDPLKEAVFVGYDGDPEGEGQAAETDQQWAGIGLKRRDETIQVTCAVVVWRGSTSAKPVRIRVLELLDEVGQILRVDPSLGLPSPTVAEFASGQLFQAQRQSGIECRIPFIVRVKTRV